MKKIKFYLHAVFAMASILGLLSLTYIVFVEQNADVNLDPSLVGLQGLDMSIIGFMYFGLVANLVLHLKGLELTNREA